MSDLKYIRGYLERASNGSGPLTFVAATEGRKSDGLDLQMSGVKLDRFLANPVIPWAHNYMATPIGRGIDPRVDKDRLLVDVEFDGEDDFAQAVESKYRRGFMNAVSVGFDPLKVEDEDGKSMSAWDAFWKGGIVTEWELVEVSAVPVPMDPEALVESGRMAKRELAQGLLEAFDPSKASDLLDALDGGDPAPVGRAVVEIVADTSNLDAALARVGAVLSGRNRDRLTQARDLIAEVLTEAEKNTDDDEEEESRTYRALIEAFERNG